MQSGGNHVHHDLVRRKRDGAGNFAVTRRLAEGGDDGCEHGGPPWE